MTFGVKLKALRQLAGLTQSQLADASGVPVGTIRDYEQNKRDPLLSSAQKLAVALGKPLDVFSIPSLDPEPVAANPRRRPHKQADAAAVEKPAAAAAKKPRRRKGE